jgi:uncharacterized protein (TIGR02452 family)
MSAALSFLPCRDSDAMAATCRRELDVNRDVACELGQSALRAIQAGRYQTSTGGHVGWRDEVAAAVKAKISLPPEAVLPTHNGASYPETVVQVVNETTLQAAQALVAAGHRPLALNFANGVTPGGGFLNGARAQEEVLCRSTALIATLDGDPMYAAHRQRSRPDSSDWTILSPGVPVFRTDAGQALDRPWHVCFITAAAPVATRIGQPEAAALLKQRIHRVLAVARAHGYTTLVLGAWGCGAFGNDPQQTAADFRAALEHEFAGAFREVVFAITDWSPERRFLGPFRDVMQRF